ncbi:MAG: 2TM domain-containing protein [Ignavibacteria bacterium]|nr:2TM domain-containing protein [Ignavibacteria bacterium]
MTENSQYDEARKRVKALKGFYTNLFVFIVVNIFLMIINLITSPGNLWFLWVVFGWGIGIAFQAFSVFGKNAVLGSDWEEKKIKEYMDKNKTNTP